MAGTREKRLQSELAARTTIDDRVDRGEACGEGASQKTYGHTLVSRRLFVGCYESYGESR